MINKQIIRSWIDPCSQIVVYVNCVRVIRFGIVLLDETLVYVSPQNTEWDTCIINISDLNLPEGTQFMVKAIIGGGYDFILHSPLYYIPDTSTAYFEISTDSPSETPGYSYNALVPSASSPPILKCSAISAKHTDGGVVLRWGITTDSGTLIYKSGKCPKGDTLNLNLSNLNVPPGTKLHLKAIVTMGSDSMAYLLLDYDPLNSTIAKFDFYGNALKTVVVLYQNK